LNLHVSNSVFAVTLSTSDAVTATSKPVQARRRSGQRPVVRRQAGTRRRLMQRLGEAMVNMRAGREGSRWRLVTRAFAATRPCYPASSARFADWLWAGDVAGQTIGL